MNTFKHEGYQYTKITKEEAMKRCHNSEIFMVGNTVL